MLKEAHNEWYQFQPLLNNFCWTFPLNPSFPPISKDRSVNITVLGKIAYLKAKDIWFLLPAK